MDVPSNIWEVNARLQFDEPLDVADDRWVDLGRGRGEFSLDRLYRMLGIDSSTGQLRGAPARAYILFCGHRGCGKSTELRRVHKQVAKPRLLLPILVDAASALDPNNLQYQDVLLALAKELLERVPEGIDIDPVHLGRLEEWFKQRILTHAVGRDFTSDFEAGGEAAPSIPFLARLFAKLTTAVQINSSYKEELRTIVRNHFSEFAAAFNQLVLAVEDACRRADVAQRVLFLVDGTDRVSGDDAQEFFVRNVHQLQMIDALFVYATPIHLLHDGAALRGDFSGIFTLPMVKLEDKDRSDHHPGVEAMRDLLLRRAPRDLFDADETIDLLVRSSGGHPRDLLRLLQYAFQYATADTFDHQSAQAAVQALATDYRTFLEPDDYRILRDVDNDPDTNYNSERVRYLLYNLALLEYNSYWWRSHPVVRQLDGYRKLDGRGDNR